jgi:hypothetical protein
LLSLSRPAFDFEFAFSSKQFFKPMTCHCFEEKANSKSKAVKRSEGQVFGGNHSEIGTNDQKRPIWPRNDRNNFLMIVEISEAVVVLDTS